MTTSRLIFLFLLFMLSWFSIPPAHAGWGFGWGNEWEKSGLDFERGYDLNTVTTTSGKVVAVQVTGENGPAVIEITAGKGNLYLVVGPKWFWAKTGVGVTPGDDLVARGARAQGADGRSYLLTQRLTNRTTGGQVELRSEQGSPFWQGGKTMRCVLASASRMAG